MTDNRTRTDQDSDTKYVKDNLKIISYKKIEFGEKKGIHRLYLLHLLFLVSF